jgi:hypothetical protein
MLCETRNKNWKKTGRIQSRGFRVSGVGNPTMDWKTSRLEELQDNFGTPNTTVSPFSSTDPSTTVSPFSSTDPNDNCVMHCLPSNLCTVLVTINMSLLVARCSHRLKSM